MLIFVAKAKNKAETLLQIKEALDSGCRWIQLQLQPDDNGLYSKEIVEAVYDELKGLDVILTIENDLTLVKEKRVHGIHLDEFNTINAIDVRRELGPHAIIGVTTKSPDEIKRLYDFADIDYVTVKNLTDNELQTITTRLTSMNVPVPVVVQCVGQPNLDKCSAIFGNGGRGIIMSVESSDVSATHSVTDVIRGCFDTIDAALTK
ncbi:MAG: thiamine phosphate synthase [Muribaculum sp.]|nr:thiamine phosphate synthase [Muribaculaceae bacterium]MCM1080935.1 thiamine phosphate synthase [Muribaculum sp.]